MDASKTLLITVLITSAFSAPVSKAADVTPTMPKNQPESWLTYHLAHPGPGADPGRRGRWYALGGSRWD